MRRRDFLQCTAAAGGLALLSIGSDAFAIQNASAGQERLIVVFLRGAVDGLSVVIPYADQDYYTLRPGIAIAKPGQSGGSLELDDHFALHPALDLLMPLWKERSLAFVHASGSPNESRSHFEAQAYMETGTPGVGKTPDGWMNRTLASLPGKHQPTEAVNFGDTLPKILQGSMPVASMSTEQYGHRTFAAAPEMDPLASGIFDRLYAGNDPVSLAYREGRVARTQLMSDLARDMTEAAGGAPSAKGFPDDAAKLCRLMKQDPSIQMAFFGLSGWDTHIRQGGAEGQLANHLRPVGQGLAELRTGLGEIYGRTVVLVVSEFGRTARENGNGGTDHGHGNAIWVLGGPVNGGRVYGRWPGLDEESLHEGRDLAVTTDFRDVAGGVLKDHLKLTAPQIGAVFPGAGPQTPLNLVRV